MSDNPSQTVYRKAIATERDGKRVVATDFSEDRDGERVDPKGVDISNFMNNPIMLFAHDHERLPVGVARNIMLTDTEMTFEPEFSEATQFSRDVKALWDEGVLKAVSIGFVPKDMEDNVFTKSELLEISVVNVPSNPNALAQAKQKGLNTGIVKKEISGDRDLPTAPRNREWDGDAAEARIREWAGGPDKEDVNFDQYKRAFAWRNAEDPENFTSYKLPFADVIDGELRAVWRGVVAAQAALLGARGGVDIPDDDRRRIHNFLGDYYSKFDEEQPEFRSFSSVEEVIKANEEQKLPSDIAIELISALHPEKKQGESDDKVDAGAQEEKTSEEKSAADAYQDHMAQLVDAMHLAMQHINKVSNEANQKAKYVRRKREQESER